MISVFHDRNEDKIKQLEKKVNELIEESCLAKFNGENALVSGMIMIQFIAGIVIVNNNNNNNCIC